MPENPLIPQVIGWGGMANVFGGVCVALAYVFHPEEATPAVVASNEWFIVHVGFMFSLLGGVFALFALLGAYLRNRGGIMGVLACTMAVLSLISILGSIMLKSLYFPSWPLNFQKSY